MTWAQVVAPIGGGGETDSAISLNTTVSSFNKGSWLDAS